MEKAQEKQMQDMVSITLGHSNVIDQGLKFGMRGMLWIPEKRVLIVVTYDGTLYEYGGKQMRKVFTCNVERTLSPENNCARCISYSSKFSQLIVGIGSQKVAVFRLERAGRLKLLKNLLGKKDQSRSVLSVDEYNRFAVTREFATQIYHLGNLKMLNMIHWSTSTQGADMVFIPKWKYLGISFKGGEIKFLDIETAQLRLVINCAYRQKFLRSLQYNQESGMLFAASGFSGLGIWEIKEKQSIAIKTLSFPPKSKEKKANLTLWDFKTLDASKQIYLFTLGDKFLYLFKEEEMIPIEVPLSQSYCISIDQKTNSVFLGSVEGKIIQLKNLNF